MSDQTLMKIHKIMELSNIPSKSIFYKLEGIKIKWSDEEVSSDAVQRDSCYQLLIENHLL